MKPSGPSTTNERIAGKESASGAASDDSSGATTMASEQVKTVGVYDRPRKVGGLATGLKIALVVFGALLSAIMFARFVF